MKKKVSLYEPTDLQMDVKDMSFFPDESFDAVVDKGMLESLHYSLCQILQILVCKGLTILCCYLFACIVPGYPF